MSAHLAGVVASLSVKPVLAVPVYRPETAGFDALLSMGQMPKGIPVSTMGFGKHGFINAALTAVQIFALSDPELAQRLTEDRAQMARAVGEDDAKHRQDYHG
jgi:5-(carboxyamino)imidazole ribonucleotide mutase